MEETNNNIWLIDKKDGFIYIKNINLEKISEIINKKIIDNTYIKFNRNELATITHKLTHNKYICYYLDHSKL